MRESIDLAIIGAGPYGLSIAAHLRDRNVDFRIFGRRMSAWKTAMPRGMLLKSEGFASNLSAPRGAFPLHAFCSEQGLHDGVGSTPVALETFIRYGEAFQERFVPDLEEELVTALEPAGGGFELRFAGRPPLQARRVIVATGIERFGHIPPEFAALPGELVSHSSAHADLQGFAGKTVAVVGAGASAVDLAALLKKQNADVTLIARAPALVMHSPPGSPSLRKQLLAPRTPLGPGWKNVLCVKGPLLFHRMPEDFRVRVVRRHIGPAAGWFVRRDFEVVPRLLATRVAGAREMGGRVRLELTGADGSVRGFDADHVITATGYRIQLSRLSFLSERIVGALRCAATAPALSRNFESSIPGLYFVGAAAANSFGPLLRFVCGVDFTAPRIARHLALTASRPLAAPAPTMRGRASIPDASRHEESIRS